MNSEDIKKWLKKPENLFLTLLLSFAIVIRLFYFIKVGEQSIWWDEGDYLAIAKVWALGQTTPEWWAHFAGMRPLLIPFIWAAMFRINFSEIFVRFFTLLLPSILAVYLTYLVGKDLYNKTTGLIASFMMSCYWVWGFYSHRLLTDIPSVFLGMLSIYFFISIYQTQNKNYGLYLSILFGVLAFSTRFPLALVLISIVLYLIFIKKFSLLRDKTIWKAAGFGILCLSPYVIYFFYTKFFLFQFYFGEQAVSVKQAIQWNIIPMLYNFINPSMSASEATTPIYFHFWGLALILGIFSLYSLFLGFDIFWKQQDKKYNSDFFVMLFLIVHLVFYIIIFRAANDRWLLMLMPFIFILSAKGIVFGKEIISRYNKEIALGFTILLIVGGAIFNLTHANDLINMKKDSYQEIKSGGEWLKENTPQDAKIITASIVQSQYYSERQSYDYYTNDSIWKTCTDLYGNLNTNDSCQKGTEEAFNKKLERIKPDYLIVSVFEPVFTPQWAYTYSERYNLTAVQAYSQGNQPILIIYRFNK